MDSKDINDVLAWIVQIDKAQVKLPISKQKEIFEYWEYFFSNSDFRKFIVSQFSYSTGSVLVHTARGIDYLHRLFPTFHQKFALPWTITDEFPYYRESQPDPTIRKFLETIEEIRAKEEEICVVGEDHSTGIMCSDALRAKEKRRGRTIPLTKDEKEDNIVIIEAGEFFYYTMEYIIKKTTVNGKGINQGDLKEHIHEKLGLGNLNRFEEIKKWIKRIIENENNSYDDWHKFSKDWFLKKDIKNKINSYEDLFTLMANNVKHESISNFKKRLRFNPETEIKIYSKNILFFPLHTVDGEPMGFYMILTLDNEQLLSKNSIASIMLLFRTLFRPIRSYCQLSLTSRRELEQTKSESYVIRDKRTIEYEMSQFKLNIDDIFSTKTQNRLHLKTLADKAITKKEGIKEEYFCSPPDEDDHNVNNVSMHKEKGVSFIIARRWNSFTPFIPSDKLEDLNSEQHKNLFLSVGGGYFLSAHGLGIVIDPGYNFLKTLYHYHHYTIKDVDAIIITHNHPDHHADLLSFLTLNFELNKWAKKKRGQRWTERKIVLYMNEGTKELYETFIKNRNLAKIEPMPSKLTKIAGGNYKGDPERYNKIELTKIRAYHTDISGSKAFGVLFQIKMNNSDKPLNIAITGDTKFPSPSNLIGFTSHLRDIDVFVAHLGGIEGGWSQNPEQMEYPPSTITYKGEHLGVNGCGCLFGMVKPKIAGFISEFGEETKKMRAQLANDIRKISELQNIFPTDLSTEIVIVDDKDKNAYLWCNNCNTGYIPISKDKDIRCDEDKENNIIYKTDIDCRFLPEEEIKFHEKFKEFPKIYYKQKNNKK